MRKICFFLKWTFAVSLAAVFMCGCVDSRYSLDNIGKDDTAVGDVITTPPVTAHLSIEGIFGGVDVVKKIMEDNGFSIDDIGAVEVAIPSDMFLIDLPLTMPIISEDMKNMLNTPDGELDLILNVKSTLPLDLEFRLDLKDDSGRVVVSFDDLTIQKASGEGQVAVDQRQDIMSLLSEMPRVKQMSLTLLRRESEKVKFTLDNYIEITVRLEKRGGISI